MTLYAMLTWWLLFQILQLRLDTDSRFDTLTVLQNVRGKRAWQQFVEAAGKTRPTLLETTIGLDYIIPGKLLQLDGMTCALCTYGHVVSRFAACCAFWTYHPNEFADLQAQAALPEQLCGIHQSAEKQWLKSSCFS